MVKKSIIGTICTCLAVASFHVSAAVVSIDWLTSGDGLITRDAANGLDWLDLTETNGLSYDYVSGQLGSGGQFDGWRYADNAEVVALWSNFGINLSAGQVGTISGFQDSNVGAATFFLGDTRGEADPGFWTGAQGITSEVINPDRHQFIGASNNIALNFAFYADAGDGGSISDAESGNLHYGSYLVKSNVVPVPAAVWLFGSGLLGLVGVARRKKA